MDSNWFGKLVLRLRNKQGITQEKLCSGICSASMLAYIEKGERVADKLLRERLLGRLRTSSDGYENFLSIEDYGDYVRRQNIIEKVEMKDSKAAEELIEAYNSGKKKRDALVRQFCLVMLAQLRIYDNADRRELYQLFGQAVKLTIPDIDTNSIEKKQLSIQELNMILEYIKYSEEAGIMEKYNEVMEYVEKAEFDIASKAKLYPKVIYYICCQMLAEKKKDNINTYKKVIKLCDKGIDVLGNYKRMYYLMELLALKKQTLEKMYELLSAGNKTEQAEKITEQLKITTEYVQVIGDIYTEYGFSGKMDNYCYLYREKNTYCVGEVIKKRRQMLGISREELCVNVCAKITLENIETGQTGSQAEIIDGLLKKLNLPGVYQCSGILTCKYSDIELKREMNSYINEKNYKKARGLLKKLKESLDMNESVNKQFICREEAVIEYNLKKITQQEYVSRLKEALNYSLSIENVLDKKEMYLTDNELHCFYSMLKELEDVNKEKEIYINILKKMYETHGKEACADVGMYELIMTYVASYHGNIAKYDESDEESIPIINECLKNGRMAIIPQNIYCIHWNNKQRLIKKIPVDGKYDAIIYLKRSIIICRLSKQDFFRDFYESKLKEYIN